MYCSNIKIQPARSDLCDKCDQWLVSLRHSLSDEQCKNINDRNNKHNTKTKAFRDSHNANIEVAEKEWRGKRDKIVNRFCISWNRGSICLPSSHMPTWTYKCSTLLTTANRGGTTIQFTAARYNLFQNTRCLACVEPLSRQVFFLIDEAQQVGKGAAVVVSLVHAFFHLHGLGERRVTLQADNCVGQNKNTIMMWYLAWRVITGQHDRIESS